MAGLAHDGEFAGAIQVALRGEAGAQGMAGVLCGIEPGGFGGAFYDQAHGILVQADGTDVAVAIDAAK